MRFDRRLSFEASAYHIDWNDIQLYTLFNNSQLLANAGKAQVDGFEAQITARPTRLLAATANLAYTNSRLTQVDPGGTAIAGAVAGDRIPQTPRWTASANLDQQVPLGGEHARTVGRDDPLSVGSGHVLPGSLTDPNVRLPSNTTIDLRAGLKLRNYQIQFRVENVANHVTVSSYVTGSPSYAYLTRPRTFVFAVSTTF